MEGLCEAMLEIVWPWRQEGGQIRYMRPDRKLHWFYSKVQEAWSIGATMNDGRDVKGERAGGTAQWLEMPAAKPDGLVHSPGGGDSCKLSWTSTWGLTDMY